MIFRAHVFAVSILALLIPPTHVHAQIPGEPAEAPDTSAVLGARGQTSTTRAQLLDLPADQIVDALAVQPGVAATLGNDVALRGAPAGATASYVDGVLIRNF